MIQAAWRRPSWWIEMSFAIGTLLLIASAMRHLYVEGYLPQPFFYEPADTFMDWFNTAYWSRQPGTYDDWRTIYPPLSFAVIRVLGIDHCYENTDPQFWRPCDWAGIVAIHAMFVINVILISKAFLKTNRRTALPRAIALSAGLPMVFALERGNILMLAFSCFLLAYGPLVRSARARWVFAALAVNFKVYLIGGVVAQLLKRRWLRVEGTMMAIVVVYLLSYVIQGVGTPAEIYSNIADYSTSFITNQVLDIWYSLTYKPILYLLTEGQFPVTTVIGSTGVDILLIVIPVVILLGQVSVLLAAVAAWVRPEVVSPHRVIFLGTVLALMNSEAGGYTHMMIIFLVFMEPWRGVARPVAIILCYILSLPGDIILGEIPPFFRESYFTGQIVDASYGAGLGFFLRPGIVIAIAVSLSWSTIRDVWLEVRRTGWRNMPQPLPA